MPRPAPHPEWARNARVVVWWLCQRHGAPSPGVPDTPQRIRPAARALGVGVPTLSAWANGRRVPPLARIAELAGVEEEVLLARYDDSAALVAALNIAVEKKP